MTERERRTLVAKRKDQIKKIRRDTAIVVFALGMGGFEIMFGGARPSVFTFLGGLILSPLVMRYDEARKEESSG